MPALPSPRIDCIPLKRTSGCPARISLCALLLASHAAHAQLAPRLDLGGTVTVGGEGERYVRALQVAGDVALYPMTVQDLLRSEEEKLRPLAPHPWSSRFSSSETHSIFTFLRPQVEGAVNSAFPFQEAVGPAWMGRGATTVLQGGVSVDASHFHLQFAPVAFVAQNANFELANNGLTGLSQYADSRFPRNIDHPQRYGDTPYSRLDLGTSTLSLDAKGIAIGASNAPQRWGPARDYPLVLGPEAGGFPHLFLGSATPIHLHFVRVQTRLIAGWLTQTPYSSAAPGFTNRFSSALVASVSPSGVPGLEFGGVRFFTTNQPGSLSGVMRVFSGLYPQHRATTINIPDENQIVSVFSRWALPSVGFELYGEWYREDYPGDVRRMLEKPDDLSDFTLGFQHILAHSPGHLRAFHAEFTNGEVSPQERGQRGFLTPYAPYIHGEVAQGHTEYGRVLGNETTFGGAGWRIGFDDFTPAGRRTIAIERALRGDYLSGGLPPGDVRPDVLYGVRFEVMRFAGQRDYGFVLVPAYDLNRNVRPGNDVFNLHASITVRGW